MKRLFCIGLALFVATTTYAKEPKWFENKTPSAYPVDEFIIGFGKSTSSEKAVLQAQSEIASQLETTIHSTTTITEYESQTTSSITTEQTHQSTLSTEVLKRLQGVEVVKREKSGEAVYIMAVLSKKNFLGDLSKEIDSQRTEINSKLKKAKTEELKRHIQKAIILYDAIAPLCTEHHNALTLFNALSKSKKTTDVPSPSQLDTLLTDMIEGFSLVVKSGDNQTAKPAEELEEPIIFYATYKNLPYPNVPIVVHYSDGSPIAEGETEEDGTFETTVLAIPYPAQKAFVRASLLIQVPARLKNSLDNSITAAYSLAFSQINTLQLVAVKNPSDQALSGLFKLIESYGITWSNDSPFIVEAELEDTTISTLPGMTQQYIATVTWTLRVRLQNGNSLGTMRVKGQSINKNQEKAQAEAYQKLDLSKTAFYELLSKITKAKVGY